MATSAFESPEERPLPPPISAHPAFPAIVALWFAALLGLGSLVLPPVLLERFFSATGLASLIPAAAPPLGFMARAVIAVVAALAGAALGRAIARRVAAPHTASPETESETSKPAFGTKRPISVHEELGGEGVTNGHAQPLSRRRALLIAEADEPDDFLDLAPLPEGDAYASANPYQAEPTSLDDEEEPLELTYTAQDEGPWIADELAETPAVLADEDQEPTERQDFQPVRPFQEFAEPAASNGDLEASSEAPEPQQPLAASSLYHGEPEPVEEALEAELDAGPEIKTEIESEPVLKSVADEPAETASPGEWEEGPLEEMGLVQLAQRLSATIEKRREWIARDRSTPATASLLTTGVEPARADEAAEAMTAYFGSAPSVKETPVALADEEVVALEATNQAEAAVEESPAPALRPAFLRGLSTAAAEDDEDEVDPFAAFSLPLRRPALAPAATSEIEDDQAEEEDAEDLTSEGAFRSLLTMRPGSSMSEKKFVRFEESELEADPVSTEIVSGEDEPIAPTSADAGAEQRLFDPPEESPAAGSPSPPAPEDTDAALRAALATLQRMGGAG